MDTVARIHVAYDLSASHIHMLEISILAWQIMSVALFTDTDVDAVFDAN